MPALKLPDRISINSLFIQLFAAVILLCVTHAELIRVGGSKWFQTFAQLYRNGNGRECISLHRYQHEMSSGDQVKFAITPNLKVQANRRASDLTHEDRDLQKIIQFCCLVEVTFKMNSWQPDVQLIEHYSIRQASRPEEFGFSKLKEANVSAIEDNARGIDITPANPLLDCEFAKQI